MRRDSSKINGTQCWGWPGYDGIKVGEFGADLGQGQIRALGQLVQAHVRPAAFLGEFDRHAEDTLADRLALARDHLGSHPLMTDDHSAKPARAAKDALEHVREGTPR
jgi:hypothetical protein